MSNGKDARILEKTVLEPIGPALQLGERAYQALLNGIVSGQIELGTQLRADTIAEQLEVSTTPVREALGCLEKDGLVALTDEGMTTLASLITELAGADDGK